MRRRLALAIALGLTTVTTFAMIAVGMRGGLFGATDGGAEAETASADGVSGALQYLAALNAEPSAADPEVITEYVYVDAPADPPQVTYVTRPAAGSAQTQQAAADEEPTLPIAEDTPAAVRPAPTPPPSEEDGGGEDDGDREDEEHAEDEFVGTVTAISGDLVTFEHEGDSTVVRVTKGLSELELGARVKVHAILVSGGWVAKEIEA